MRSALACLVLAGCFSDGTGTVVYSESNTSHIMTVDVATGTQTTLALGSFGNVSIAPDRQHVVYLGDDGIPKLSDLLGNVGQLASTNFCNGPFAWTANTLTYCIADQIGLGTIGFMPAIGAPVRVLDANLLATSKDGARIAYVHRTDNTGSENGDLVVEDGDGGNHQVLRPNTDVTSLAFLPDGSGLLVVDIIQENAFTPHLARIAFADGARTDLGAGLLPDVLPHGSRFSPTGTEALAIVSGALVAVDLESGESRRFSTLDASESSMSVAFLAQDRVIASRIDSVFMGDIGNQVASVRISDGTKETVLVASNGSSECFVADLDVGAGLAALVCAVPAIIDFDGALVTSRNGTVALGLSGDGSGMVTVNSNGEIEYVSLDGNVKQLATALTSNGTATLPGPFAAYAP